MIATLARRFVRPLPPMPATATVNERGDADDALPAGCGWFDSSHELRTGLVVVEHASADAVAAQMPLDDWLALHLGGWRAPAAAGSGDRRFAS